jgi:hypothetical protein
MKFIFAIVLCIHITLSYSQGWVQLSLQSQDLTHQQAIREGLFYLYSKPEQRIHVKPIALYFVNLSYNAEFKVVFGECKDVNHDVIITEVIMFVGKNTSGKFEIVVSTVYDKYSVIKINNILYSRITLILDSYLHKNYNIQLKYINNVYLYDEKEFIQCDVIGTKYEKGKAVLSLLNRRSVIEVSAIFLD